MTDMDPQNIMQIYKQTGMIPFTEQTDYFHTLNQCLQDIIKLKVKKKISDNELDTLNKMLANREDFDLAVEMIRNIKYGSNNILH